MHILSDISRIPPSSADLDSYESRKWPRAVRGNAPELVRFKEACAAFYAPVPFKLKLRSKEDLFTVRELSRLAYMLFKQAEHDYGICHRARLDAVMACVRCEGDARLSRFVETSCRLDSIRASWLAIYKAMKDCERRRRAEPKWLPVNDDGAIYTGRTMLIDGERLPVVRSAAL